MVPFALIAALAVADTRQAAESTDAIEPPPILVVGVPPRCQPRPRDPLDDFVAKPDNRSVPQVLKRDPATGLFGLFTDDYPLTGPGVWQRVGTGFDQYLFRAPEDGTPLCIGARSKGPVGWAQLRQIVDAKPYRGKIVRVTMWAATRKAARTWFWVASGREYKRRAPRRADQASESGNVDFSGTHSWTPVSLEMGPIRCDQLKISFGAMLDGPGDLWIYQPQIEVIGEQSAEEAERDCREVENND
jgi:hypothetical protein